GAHAVVHIGPDRTAAVTSALVCTNHQERVTWPGMAARSRTVERHAALSDVLAASPDMDALPAALLARPLYVRGPNVLPVYTASYRPTVGTVDYLWPARRWRQSFAEFALGRYEHEYGEP